MRPNLITAFCICLLASCSPVKKTTLPLEELQKGKEDMHTSLIPELLKPHSHLWDSIMVKDSLYRVQVIYTQIERDEKGTPTFTHHYFNPAPSTYFYPASTVKLPLAVLALEKINDLNIPSFNRTSTLIFPQGSRGQKAVYNDPETADGRATIENYIRKIFAVSDNDAFNRLYDFLGQEWINSRLHALGYDSTEIIHRLSIALSEKENRATNGVRAYDTSGRLLFEQPPMVSNYPYAKRETFLGRGYIQGDKLVNAPFNFSTKNRITLAELHSMVAALIFPENQPEEKRFRLRPDDYRFLYNAMRSKPQTSQIPVYSKGYDEGYVKFLMFGAKGSVGDSVQILNKVGNAYGFLTDVAYIINPEKGVEFILSATIHCNTDGVYNDGVYDYDKGYQFLKELGGIIYNHELGRVRKYRPDLTPFISPSINQ